MTFNEVVVAAALAPPGLAQVLPRQTSIFTNSSSGLQSTGEPTVLVPVAQLTATSSHVVTMSGALSAIPQSTSNVITSKPSTTSSSAAQASSTSIPSSGPSTSDGETTSNAPAPGTSASTRSSQVAGSPSTTAPNPAISSSSIHQKSSRLRKYQPPHRPISNRQDQRQRMSYSNILSIVSQIGGQGTATTPLGVESVVTTGSATSNLIPVITLPPLESGSKGSLTNVAAGSQVVTPQPAGSSAVVIGSQTIAIGSSAITQDGRTISLAAPSILVVDGQTISAVAPSVGSSGEVVTVGTKACTASTVAQTGVVVAGQTIFSGTSTLIGGATVSVSSGNLVMVSGTPTTVIALNAVVSGNQVVTLGTQAYTASIIHTPAVVIGGYTVAPNAATVINGETVSLAGSQIVLASGSQTSNVSLGGAIMSGIGGQASSTSVEPYTGEGSRMVKLSTDSIFVALILLLVI